MRVGILGGTFDPVHLGHLIIAEQARVQLDLRKVIFIPAGKPWMKSDKHISSAEHRVAMLRLAVNDNPAFEISTIEIKRQGPSYTVDTLEVLHNKLGNDSKIYLLIGWDALNALPSWKDPDKIIKLAVIVSVARPGYEKPDIDLLESKLPGARASIIVLDHPLIEISSTDIKNRLTQNKSIKYLVPYKVERYIYDNAIYSMKNSIDRHV